MSIKLSSYYYNISGEAAERLLLDFGEDGAFLARPSVQKLGDYSLSVKRNGRVTHIRIQRSDEFLDLYGGEKFATLNDLIQYYMENKLQEKTGEEIELRFPLCIQSSCFDDTAPGLSANSVTCERWFHVGLTSGDAEKLLREQGKFGSFLVRESQSSPGQYAISVKLEKKITHIMIQQKISESGDIKYDVGGGDQFESLHQLLEHYKVAPMVEANGHVVHLKTALPATRFLASTILERVPDLTSQRSDGTAPSASSRGPFSKEFETLEQFQFPRKYMFDRKEGGRPENVKKNRYKNIVPHDHTRIVLTDADPAVPGSDYINANLIRVLAECPDLKGIDRTYISTQGCLNNTVDDMWRMVWQQNTRVIVMATKEIERARPKCVRYWPDLDKSRRFGLHQELIVKCVDEVMTNDYALRTLEMSNTMQPENPSSVLRFLDKINECSASVCPSEAGPIVVHCSAGIGRTGTIIAIDLIVNQIKQFGVSCAIDIASIVRMLREQRSGMVQTEQQYEFIYVAVRYFVETLLKQNRQQQQQQQQQKQWHEYSNIDYQQQQETADAIPPYLNVDANHRIIDLDNPLNVHQSFQPPQPDNASGNNNNNDDDNVVVAASPAPPPLPKRTVNRPIS